MTTADRLRARLARKLTLEVLGEDRDWSVSYLGSHLLGPGGLYAWHAPGALLRVCKCERCLIARLKDSVFSGRKDWRALSTYRRQDLAAAFPNSNFLGKQGLDWLRTVNVCVDKMCADLKGNTPSETTETGGHN